MNQADVAPAASLHPAPGLRQHRVCEIDTDDLTVRSDRLLKEGEVQPGTAADLDHCVTGTELERLHGLAAGGPHAEPE